MACVGQITLKKNLKNFFTIFFILYQKIPLVSSLENSPYFIFFPKDDSATIIYNFLFLRPCTLFVWQTLQNGFGFFIRLVSFFWFWNRQYNLPWPYRIYYILPEALVSFQTGFLTRKSTNHYDIFILLKTPQPISLNLTFAVGNF